MSSIMYKMDTSYIFCKGCFFAGKSYYKGRNEILRENYEQKLELVKAVREENRSNEARMSHRENIFYGYSGLRPHAASFANEREGTAGENQTEENPFADKGKRFIQGFILRSLTAVILVLCFFGIKKGRIDFLKGITDKEITRYVKEDFSGQVVDYLTDFTYNPDYEKTSIKR